MGKIIYVVEDRTYSSGEKRETAIFTEKDTGVTVLSMDVSEITNDDNYRRYLFKAIANSLEVQHDKGLYNGKRYVAGKLKALVEMGD